MRTKRISTVLTLVAAAALLLPLTTQGQLGGLKIPGVGAGTVTAESLNTDLSGGLDYFAKANSKFMEAVGLKTQSAAYEARIKAALDDKKLEEASGIEKEQRKVLSDAVDKLVEENKPLADGQKKLVKEGQGEAAKGVAKWGAVSASLAMAAKSGNSNAQLATAIPAAQQMLKDLPDINKMLSTINKLNKIK